jgi:glutamate-1-semialdehyde 2,1-aminomutase
MTAHFPVDGNRDFIRADSVEEVAALRDLFWYEMLDQGFWLARRGFMALILETPPAEFDRFIEAVRHFILKYKEFVSL